MAKLSNVPYPGDWEYRFAQARTREGAAQENRRLQALLDAVPQDRMIGFPVADGSALYYVQSFRPLVLQHIPYGDAYRADPALIRGLTESDVRRRIQAAANMRSMFARRA